MAPFILSSSSAVNTTSSGGWTILSDASSASPMATAIPLSAPRVVSVAYK